MSKMKFLVYFCLSLALATTALARRNRNAMAMATLEKLESLLSEEMALEQAYEQELAEEQAYEQELAEEEAYEQELAEEQAYEQELAEEQAYEQELAEEQAYEQELERQNLIAALQSACGRGSGAHVQALSALADLLSTGEVTAQEAMNYIEAQGLDKHIARAEAATDIEQVLAEEQAYEKAYVQELERQNLIAALQSACGSGSGAHVQTLSALADLLSTGEVTAQEAMNYLKAQGLDKHIAQMQIDLTKLNKEVKSKVPKAPAIGDAGTGGKAPLPGGVGGGMLGGALKKAADDKKASVPSVPDAGGIGGGMLGGLKKAADDKKASVPDAGGIGGGMLGGLKKAADDKKASVPNVGLPLFLKKLLLLKVALSNRAEEQEY